MKRLDLQGEDVRRVPRPSSPRSPQRSTAGPTAAPAGPWNGGEKAGGMGNFDGIFAVSMEILGGFLDGKRAEVEKFR